jgi:hypothetical protein
MMSVLTHESHLHLYGCLNHDDLWALFPSRLNRHPARVEWYKAEFKKLTGQTVFPEKWALDPSGYSDFKDFFLCRNTLSFAHFQARFNLLIALFPPDPEDLQLANAVFSRDSRQSTGIKEYRTFLPLYLDETNRERYLKNLIESALAFSNTTWQPRFAISFLRSHDETWQAWTFLQSFMDRHPELAQWITGIDFCGSEMGHPPREKIDFFRDVYNPKKQERFGLEILYHVGEMWDDIALHSAARWCIESLRLGVRRLGHALALGLNPEVLRGKTIREPRDSVNDHFFWLRKNARDLHENGFGICEVAQLLKLAEASKEQHHIAWHYGNELIELTTKFQDTLMTIARKFDAVIECCPTSNLRIGGIKDPSMHPLGRFIDHALKVTIATDDPGIFNIQLKDEEKLCRAFFGLTDETLLEINNRAYEILTNRVLFSRHLSH